jgi:hypothetical protein
VRVSRALLRVARLKDMKWSRVTRQSGRIAWCARCYPARPGPYLYGGGVLPPDRVTARRILSEGVQRPARRSLRRKQSYR